MIVVDTNLIGYLFLTSPRSELAERVLEHDSAWTAPMLWRSELRNVLALYMRQRLLSLDEALVIMDSATDFMQGREFAVASSDILRLAQQTHLSAYDCEFVALAEALQIDLVTADKKLPAAFPRRALSPEAFCDRNASPAATNRRTTTPTSGLRPGQPSNSGWW